MRGLNRTTRKIFTRKVRLYRSDYFPLFKLTTLPVRVQVISVYVIVKVVLLYLICDFGPFGYGCAEELLKLMHEDARDLPSPDGLWNFCAPFTFSASYRDIGFLIFWYLAFDISVYIALFISEEWVARDRLGRNVNMNCWREEEIFSRQYAK